MDDCAWQWRFEAHASPPKLRMPVNFAFARELQIPDLTHVGMAGTADAIEKLERGRLLGPDVNYAHGNMLTDREFNLVAASKGTLSITPSSDMLMQFGTYPGTGRALERNITCGFGVDTICSAVPDLFSEMRSALAAERSRANVSGAGAWRKGSDCCATSTRHAPPCHDRRGPRLESRLETGEPDPWQAG